MIRPDRFVRSPRVLLCLIALAVVGALTAPTLAPAATKVPFSLGTRTGTLTIVRGGSAKVTVDVKRSSGFRDSVALGFRSLPTGVTVTTPKPVTGSTTTLTFKTTSRASLRSTRVTLSGSSKGRTATTSFTIRVVASGTSGGSASGTEESGPVGGTRPSNPVVPQPLGGATTVPGATTSTIAGSTGTTLAGATTSTVAGATTSTASGARDFSLAAEATGLTVPPGTSGQLGIRIVRTGGYDSLVELRAERLPTGVTASFSPSPTEMSRSVMTVSVASTVTQGSYDFDVRSLSRTVKVQLVVGGGFTLTSAEPIKTAQQGSTVTFPITIGRTSGFTSAVALTVTGLPAGMTGSFGPETGGVSVLSIAVPADATPTVVGLFVTGTAGTLSATASLTLTVSPGSGAFNASASPTALTLATGAQTVALNLFTSAGSGAALPAAPSWTFAGPPNVTATFANITAAGAQATIQIPATVAGGTYTLSFTASVAGLGAKTVAVPLTLGTTGTPAITISSTITNLGIARGASGSITLTYSPALAVPPTLSTSNVPAGIFPTVSNATGSGVTITFPIPATFTVGTYPFQIIATGSGTGAINMTLVVT